MSEKLLPCPFCGGEARTFEYDGANQATCGGKHIDCAGTDVVAPVAMWNRRTPAPEGEAWRHVSQEEMAQAAKFASTNLASPVVPAPEGVFVSETCEGEVCWCGKPAVRKVGEEFADDEPNPDRHNLTRYICAHHFAELMGPAGARSVGLAPVVPVGVSREGIAKALFERHWSAVSASPKWPGDDDGSYWLWLADAILAALRPADTGANHD